VISGFGNEGVTRLSEDDIYLVMLVPNDSSLDTGSSCELDRSVGAASA
jgi:hypothetical protein